MPRPGVCIKTDRDRIAIKAEWSNNGYSDTENLIYQE